ncbi:MAG: phosphoesterase, partial [Candidatus Limnocylindria bacterium]
MPAAWFDLTEQLIRRTPGFSPPVASRAIGCLGVGLYEAIVPGIPDHVSLAGAVHGLPSMPSAGRSAAYHWPSV